MSIRGSAMVRPEVQEREDGALQVCCWDRVRLPRNKHSADGSNATHVCTRANIEAL